MKQKNTITDLSDTNPNYKINRYREYLSRVGKHKFKVWYLRDSDNTFNGDPIASLHGRVFKNEASAVAFAAEKKMVDGLTVQIYKWVGDRWENYA